MEKMKYIKELKEEKRINENMIGMWYNRIKGVEIIGFKFWPDAKNIREGIKLISLLK